MSHSLPHPHSHLVYLCFCPINLCLNCSCLIDPQSVLFLWVCLKTRVRGMHVSTMHIKPPSTAISRESYDHLLIAKILNTMW